MINAHDDIQGVDERLLSRLASGEADEQDWSLWSRAAENDANRWRELARMQRDHGMVQRVMDRAATAADRVALPARPNPVPIIYRIGAWSGWAVAAGVAITAVVLHFVQASTHAPRSSSPNIAQVADMSSEQAFDTYVRQGKAEGVVVDELPTRVLVTARESPDGGYELLYLRQVLERVHVPDLYMIEDEPTAPQPSAVQASYDKPKRGPM